MKLNFREARPEDIYQIQKVRNAVRENVLSDPALVSDKDCEEYLFKRGKGWVAIEEDLIIGFAIADLRDHNIWALFVHPDFEGNGTGSILHHLMLDWYFTQTKATVWLGTAPGTRAEKFYEYLGWTRIGTHGMKEVKFEMKFLDYLAFRKTNIKKNKTGIL